MKPIKIEVFPTLKITALAVALSCVTGARASTIQTALALNNPAGGENALQSAAFRDSTEAHLLRDAYRILATGDHDYAGHRVKAMHSVEAAAKILDLDFGGDLKDHSSQPLSDARLREAQGLIKKVLESADVKGEKRVVKHLEEAIHQIDEALKVR